MDAWGAKDGVGKGTDGTVNESAKGNGEGSEAAKEWTHGEEGRTGGREG